jgi:hypothetical protein
MYELLVKHDVKLYLSLVNFFALLVFTKEFFVKKLTSPQFQYLSFFSLLLPKNIIILNGSTSYFFEI